MYRGSLQGGVYDHSSFRTGTGVNDRLCPWVGCGRPLSRPTRERHRNRAPRARRDHRRQPWSRVARPAGPKRRHCRLSDLCGRHRGRADRDHDRRPHQAETPARIIPVQQQAAVPPARLWRDKGTAAQSFNSSRNNAHHRLFLQYLLLPSASKSYSVLQFPYVKLCRYRPQ